MAFLRAPASSLDLGGAEIVAYDNKQDYAAVVSGGSELGRLWKTEAIHGTMTL
jgi:hypothetical protein